MTYIDGYSLIRETAGVYDRGRNIYELRGADRQRLLDYVLARATEYVQPGTVVDSLALDENGTPVDLILAIVDETQVVLLSDADDSILPEFTKLADSLGLDDVEVKHLDTWNAVAVEGPKAWKAVASLLEEGIADVLLNEWRSVSLPVSPVPAFLARIGTTAEYGYLVIAEAPQSELRDWMTNSVDAFGGGLCGEEALLRARIEVSHPVFPSQFTGLSLRESTAAWMAGVGREEEYRGKVVDENPYTRRLMAVYSEGDLTDGDVVYAEDTVVGRIHLTAPRVGQDTVVALALLDYPFDVPDLELRTDHVTVTTVARPIVKPRSWTETIE